MRYFEFINSFDPNNPPMTFSESALMADVMQLSTKPLKQPFQQLLANIASIQANKPNPTCFISYAWVGEDVFPEQYWTQELIYRLEFWLRSAGIDSYIDRNNSRFGEDMKRFMEDQVKKSNFVLLIGTKALRAKLDSKDFYNVQVEYKFVYERVQKELQQHAQISGRPLEENLRLSVTPVIISGKGKKALPDELFGKVAIEDFSGNDIRDGQINVLVDHLRGLISKLHSINLADNNSPITQAYNNLWKQFKRQYILLRGNRAGNLYEENRLPTLYFQQAKQRQHVFGKQKLHFIHNLPENDGKSYVGRKKFIQTISQIIVHDSKPKQSQITVISGLGGVGKTSLAEQIIFQIQSGEKLPTRSIMWLRVNDQINNTLYQELIAKLGLNIGADNYATQQQWFFSWLAEHPGWILILDNVSNEEQIKGYLPPHGGNIIITSRDDRWKEGAQLMKYDLELLSDTESCDLLQQYLKNEPKQNLQELANTLGNLPLALVQAAGFIRNNRFLTIKNYIQLLQQQPIQMTQTKETQNVWATLNISLTLIKENSFKSYELLMLCALFGIADIPNTLLSQIAGYTTLLEFVTRVSPIISYYIAHADKENTTLRLHPLVSSIIFAEMSLQQKKEKIERCLDEIKLILANTSEDHQLITAIIGLFLSLTAKSDSLNNPDFTINPILYAETLLLIVPILVNQDNMPALNQLEQRWITLLSNPAIEKNSELYLNLLEKLVAYRIKTRTEFEFLEEKFNELDNLKLSVILNPALLLNRGRIASELGKFEDGVKFFNQAIATGKLSTLETANAYANLCTIYAQQSDRTVEEVEQMAQKGYDLIDTLEVSPKIVSLLTYIRGNVAEFYINRKKWDEAKQLRLSNIELLKQSSAQSINRGISWNYFSLAKIECEVGDFQLCKEYYHLFIDHMNKVFSNVSNWPKLYLDEKDKIENMMQKRPEFKDDDIHAITEIDDLNQEPETSRTLRN